MSPPPTSTRSSTLCSDEKNEETTIWEHDADSGPRHELQSMHFVKLCCVRCKPRERNSLFGPWSHHDCARTHSMLAAVCLREASNGATLLDDWIH
eukprot:2984775-Amphidinium_carterae.1